MPEGPNEGIGLSGSGTAGAALADLSTERLGTTSIESPPEASASENPIGNSITGQDAANRVADMAMQGPQAGLEALAGLVLKPHPDSPLTQQVQSATAEATKLSADAKNPTPEEQRLSETELRIKNLENKLEQLTTDNEALRTQIEPAIRGIIELLPVLKDFVQQQAAKEQDPKKKEALILIIAKITALILISTVTESVKSTGGQLETAIK